MKKESDKTRKNHNLLKDKTNRSEQTDNPLKENKKDGLTAREELFQLFSEATEEGIALHDNGIILEANHALARMFGYKLSEIIGISAEKLAAPESWMKIKDNISVVSEKTHEGLGVRKDGSTFACSVVGKPYQYKNRALRVAAFRDITDRIRVEDDLRRSEKYFKEITENTSDIIIITDEQGLIKYCSPSMERFAGYKPEEVIGKNAFGYIHPDEVKLATEEYSNAVQNRNAPLPPNAFRIMHKDGSIRYFAGTGKVLLDHQDIAGVVTNIHDITEQKLAEESLRQNEEKYRTILDNMQEGYFEADFKGNLTFFNDVICQHCGYSRDELNSMNSRQFTDEETSRNIFHICEKIYLTGEPYRNLNWQIITKKGSRRDIEGSIFLLQDASGKPKGFRGIAHDITERRQTDEAIKQSEEKYRLLADHMKDQVWTMDLNLNMLYISPSVEKLLGYTFDEIKEMSLDKLLTSESLQNAMDFFLEEMPKALASPDYVLTRPLEMQFCCKNGRTVWGESMFSFIRDENGGPVSILGEGRNITERKQMENALKKSEENFRRSLDDSPLGVRISTIEGKTIYANNTILDIYGYESVEELQNTPLQERYTPESYAEYEERKKKRLRGEPGPSEYEISIIRKNGEIRHLHVFRKEIFWSGKKQSQVIYQDITLRRQAEEKLNETLENLRQSIKITIQVLGTASEAKDPYMAGHQRRVSDLARAIATEMKLSHDKIEAIRMASAIHDIGKISIPSEILCKPAILSDLEFSLVKNHPFYSYEIIKEVESPWPLADIVYQHHERLNGSGYPRGLKNGDILIESRILAVADVVEAMISYRPYRPALGMEIALAEIENNAGILYDRNAVDACLRLFREKNFQMA
jgi:PAS domain S-box-containing protein